MMANKIVARVAEAMSIITSTTQDHGQPYRYMFFVTGHVA